MAKDTANVSAHVLYQLVQRTAIARAGDALLTVVRVPSHPLAASTGTAAASSS
jgi:hypothetical protein